MDRGDVHAARIGSKGARLCIREQRARVVHCISQYTLGARDNTCQQHQQQSWEDDHRVARGRRAGNALLSTGSSHDARNIAGSGRNIKFMHITIFMQRATCCNLQDEFLDQRGELRGRSHVGIVVGEVLSKEHRLALRGGLARAHMQEREQGAFLDGFCMRALQL